MTQDSGAVPVVRRGAGLPIDGSDVADCKARQLERLGTSTQSASLAAPFIGWSMTNSLAAEIGAVWSAVEELWCER